MQKFDVCFKDGETRRLDVFIADTASLTRSHAVKLIEGGDVLVNGKSADKKYKLRVGDKVEITIPDPEEYEVEPQDIPLDIVYEDDSLLVVNKPKGMVVHPAAGNLDGTLVNAVLFHCGASLSGINGVLRPGSLLKVWLPIVTKSMLIITVMLLNTIAFKV